MKTEKSEPQHFLLPSNFLFCEKKPKLGKNKTKKNCAVSFLTIFAKKKKNVIYVRGKGPINKDEKYMFQTI